MNCSRSAIDASSSLAPTAILIPSDPNMLIPAPATGNTRVQARANRTGSNSGAVTTFASAAYAAVNSSVIATVMPPHPTADRPAGTMFHRNFRTHRCALLRSVHHWHGMSVAGP